MLSVCPQPATSGAVPTPEYRSRRAASPIGKEMLSYVNLGMTIAVALAGCGAIGWWLDRQLGSSPIALLSGLGVGFAVAMREIWKLLQKLNNPSEGSHP